MPKRVCRIRWRKGEPLSLVKYTAPTFLDLSREIRDRIYYEVLVSPDPIIVCSMHYDYNIKCKDGKYTLIEATTLDPLPPICPPLTLALIYSSRQIAAEAIATFYSRNTFKFTGHETWQPMYRWLSIIGEGGRVQLRSVVAEVRFPYKLTQDRNGSHRFHNHWDVPWQFHRVERSYNSTKDPLEAVEYLSPAIEACFRILGKAGHALTLRLILPQGVLPGVLVWYEGWDNLAIPELVEKLRTEFTAGRVAVLWEGVGLRARVLEQRAIIHAKGWEIVEERECPTPLEYVDRFEIPRTRFTARRTQSLILESPNSCANV